MPAYILTLSCPDRTGIVHAVSGFLLERGGNIEEAAQFNDPTTGLFFMRVRFACSNHPEAALREQLTTFAGGFGMHWQLHAAAEPATGSTMIAATLLASCSGRIRVSSSSSGSSFHTGSSL